MPPGVVTVTSTAPAEPAGLAAVICVALSTVKLAALAEPNCTAVAPVKLVPVMVTDVPPASGPLVGEMLVTVGPGVPTVTEAEPLAPSGCSVEVTLAVLVRIVLLTPEPITADMITSA